MRKLKLLYLLVGLPVMCSAQNIASSLIKYFPAPGQHINIESTGTPQAAQQMPASESKLVSLGGFGGYIVLKFDEACINDPENPYGIDFTVFGNAFSGSSEAGVIWVMQDENNNGLPDDTWYEIAGSHHYFSETQHDYQLTYYKTSTRDINWKDNSGSSGTLEANSYNLQEYYPVTKYFPDYPKDSVTFNGTLLPIALDDSDPMNIVLSPLDFGYADNHPKKQGVALTIPDNPYTEEIEGAGGDPIDISWAVDKSGNYVKLSSIHFVKIVTGYFANLGRLGETSTDVSYVVDVASNSTLTGKENLLVLKNYDDKLLVGDSLQLEARYFSKGRLTSADINFESSDSQKAEVNESGEIKAKEAGQVKVVVSTLGETKQAEIQIIQPGSIELLSDFSSVYVGDTVALAALVYDNLDELLSVDISFENLTSSVGKVISQNGSWYFVAENSGEATVRCSVPGFDIEKSVSFHVFSEDDKMQVHFTLKTEEENWLPFQLIEVGKTDLNSFVDERNGDYSGADKILLSHALLAGLQKAETNMVFKDDDSANGKLYLYEVEKDGLYKHGWGGLTEQPYISTWIARLNSQQYLNDFDNVEINNGDTIALYYVSDVSALWFFTQLTANKDSVEKGDDVEILYQQTECEIQNGTVVENGFSPIVNEEITPGGSYFTNTEGKVNLVVESVPLVVSAGNDAVLLSGEVATESPLLRVAEYSIYPNPVSNQCIIEGTYLQGATVYIFDSTGQLRKQFAAESNQQAFDVSEWTAGIYFVKIADARGIFTGKIVKR